VAGDRNARMVGSRFKGGVIFALALIGSLAVAFSSLFGPARAGAEEITGTITPTAEGAAQIVSITSSGQSARYSVGVEAGESVSIITSEAALSAGYQLDWQNPEGESIDTWFPGGEEERFFEAVRFEEAGTAELLITPEEGATGSVTFTLFDASDKTADSLATSAEGTSGSFSVDVPGQREVISLEGVEGEKISIEPSEAGFEGEFHLNTPAGEWLEDSGGGLGGLHGPMTLPENGTYNIVLTGNEAQQGSVELTAFLIEDLGGAFTPTIAGTDHEVSITVPGQSARYSVPVTAGESVSMKSTEAALSAGYRLDWLNPEGENVRTWYPGGEEERFFEPVRFEESGTAKLLVRPEEGATGSVTFTLFDASDKSDSLVPGPEGGTGIFSIDAPGQRDLISFAGTEEARVSISPWGASMEGEFHVRTPAGEWLEGSGGDLEGWHGPMTLPEGGTYEIVLTGDGGQTGSVELTVFGVEEPTATVSPTTAGAAEPVDFTAPGQIAYFAVPVEAGESVSVVSSEAALSAGYRLDWLNTNGEYVRTWHLGGEEEGFFEPVRFEESGTARLLVTPQEGTTGSITFTLFDASDKTDSIVPIPEGGTGTFSIDAPGQRDLISFAGTREERLSIAPTGATLEGEFRVRTPAGEWLEGSGGDLEDPHGPMTLPEGGMYSIVLTGDGGRTGSVGLRATDLDQSGSVVPSRAGTKRSMTFVAPGESAGFSVPVTAGESVSMKSTEAALSAGYRLEWLNPKGENVGTWHPGGEEDAFFEPVRFEEGGTAKLLVTPESDGTGSLALTLFDASDAVSSMPLGSRGAMRAISVAAPGERALVDFQGSIGDQISAEPVGASMEGEFHVRTPAGEWLEGSGGDLEGVHGPMTLPEGGTYEIVLTGEGAQTGGVSICLKLAAEGSTPGCSQVATYPFDDGGGGVANDTARFNEGTIMGAEWATGRYGGALKFDAEEEDKVVIPAAPDLELGSFTVEAWVYPEGESSPAPVISQADGFALYASAGAEGMPRGEGGEGGSAVVVQAGEALPAEQWSHLALTCGGGQLTLYVDGKAVESSASSCPQASEPILVGAIERESGSEFFGGRIDEVQVYDSAATEAEIAVDRQTALQTPPPATSPEPAAAYAFEEGTGSIAGDLIGARDATLTGPEWIEGVDEGGALLFSAANHDSMEIPEIGSLGLDESFTLEADVQPRSLEGGVAPIFTAGSKGGDQIALDAVPGSGAEAGKWSLTGTVGTVEATGEAAGELRYASHEWEPVALTYDGSQVRVYVDGQLEAAGSAPELSPLEGAILVGADPGGVGYLDGGIDDVRVYRQALNGAQLAGDAAIPLENPRIIASGRLWEAGPEELVSPAEPLSLAISDAKGRVERVSFLVDGSVTRSWDRDALLENGGEENCLEDWCDLTFDAGGLLPGVSPGEHTLEIVAIDSHGVSRRRSHVVDLDTQPPSLTISGSLVEAEGGPLAEEEATLKAVTEDPGGEDRSGLAEITVYIDGAAVETQDFSGESSAELSYLYRDADWGSGPRQVAVVAKDVAGNEASQDLQVNTSMDAMTPSCSASPPEEVAPGATVSATEAEERIEEVMPAALAANSSEAGETIDPEVGGEESISSESAFGVEGSVTGGRILAMPSGGATIGQAACVLPTETTAEADGPVAIPDAAAVLYPNSGPEMDTLIRATALGSDIVDSLRGPEAPSTLSWSVATRAGQHLVPLEGGGVAVSAQDQAPVVSTEPPEALANAGDPELINAVQHQTTAAMVDANTANAELGELVEAVIPSATAVDAEGHETELPLEVDRWSGSVSVSVPPETAAVLLRLESAPDVGAMCAQAFGSPRLYESGCGPKPVNEPESMVSNVDWSPNGKIYLDSRPRGHREILPGGGWTEEITEQTILRANSDGSGLEEIIGPTFVGLEQYDLSPSGELLAFEGCEVVPGGSCGVFVDALASETISLVAPMSAVVLDASPTFAVNGKHIYYYKNEQYADEDEGYDHEVWSMKVDGSEKRQITDLNEPVIWCLAEIYCDHGVEDSHLSVGGSPEKLIFREDRNIWEVPASAEDATLEQMTKLTEGKGVGEAEFSPSGNSIIYTRNGSFESESGADIVSAGLGLENFNYEAGLYRMNPDGSGGRLLSPTSGEYEALPRSITFSPNGREVDFVSNGTVFETSATKFEYARSVTNGDDHASFARLVAELTPEQAEEEEEVEAEVQRIDLKYPKAPGEPEHPFEGETEFCLGGGSVIEVIEHLSRLANECTAFLEDQAFAKRLRFYLFHWKGEDDNTISNAFLHGFWTTLMVRDSHGETEGKPDGLVFARIHEGKPPYNKESEMDFINDRVGANYWLFDRLNGSGEDKSKVEVCNGLKIKAGNAIYLPPSTVHRPGQWARTHAYRFRRLVYYQLYSSYNGARGIFVTPTTVTCQEASEKPKIPSEERAIEIGGYEP
jgi:Tol biopolymer transport system component